MKTLFSKKAEKELTHLASLDAKRILAKISLLNFPLPSQLDIKPIKGAKDFYRLRVGKTRAIFEIDLEKKEVWIRKIGYRGGVYRF